MKEKKPRPPMNFKFIEELSLTGKMAGSAQPGGGSIDTNQMSAIINALQEGKPFEAAGVPERLISNLSFLYTAGIKVIYNLTNISNPLIKFLWENYFEGRYITELDDISIGIENFSNPTQEQLSLITRSVISELKEGKNILVHCEGGVGRTGTILAAIHMVINDINDAESAIAYIRKSYSRAAIDNSLQEESLRSFSSSGSQEFKVMLAVESDSPLSSLDKEPAPAEENNQEGSICCNVNYMKPVYYNRLLNYPELVMKAIEIKKFDDLINLGEDKEVAESLIEAVNEYGIEHILKILFSETINQTENNLSIANLSKEENYVDTTHIDYNLLLLTTLVIEELFQFISKKVSIIHMPPKYPDFDDYYSDGIEHIQSRNDSIIENDFSFYFNNTTLLKQLY